uniref:AP2/ERF domain-containing protein n=1 Tax=Leersia perrieri TaxID=77586 RepID=A0A0D9WF49_9ORYZ
MSPAESLAAGRSRRVGAKTPRPKRVRVYFVDADATDTDSSGDERSRRRVREVIDIDVGGDAASSPSPSTRWLCVWPRRRRRCWRGVAPGWRAEEAAAVYDHAALRIKGSHAVTNFDSPYPSAKRRHTTPQRANATVAAAASSPSPSPAQPEDDSAAAPASEAFNPFASPTSVLRYEADEVVVAAPSFEHLLDEVLGDLSAPPPPPTKAAEFDWLPWWEGEDFVTAGMTASNAVSVI